MVATRRTTRAASAATSSPSSDTSTAKSAPAAVDAGRFVELAVPCDIPRTTIKRFVEDQGYDYKAGCALYQLTKPEKVQANKEVVVEEIASKERITGGVAVRKMLGLDGGADKKVDVMKIDPDASSEFKIYVESTSYNRVLVGGTTVLYQDPAGGATAAAVDKVPVSTSPAAGKNTSRASPVKRSASPAGVKKEESLVFDKLASPKRPRRDKPDSPSRPTDATPNDGAASPHAAAVDALPAAVPVPVSAYDQTQLVFSFDTTASMRPCIDQVKRVVQETVRRMLRSIPKLEIAIIAHGDYQDKDTTYDIMHMDFSTDEQQICDFVKGVGHTVGFDIEECYELALRVARRDLSWRDGANKGMVVIGDATPHPLNQNNPYNIDWRVEARLLRDASIRVYGVRCLTWPAAASFFKELAQITMGHYLQLAQFNRIADFLVGISYYEAGQMGNLHEFREELRGSGSLTRNLRQLFSTLTGERDEAAATPGDLNAVEPGRFQILDVNGDMDIRTFVNTNIGERAFKPGQGFYEFNKREEVQHKKEIVLMDKATGDMFTGTQARELAGIPDHVRGQKVSPPPSDKWIMFIQSTSYNRKLQAGTRFLYEVAEEA
ncbi:hypothetical protein RI367_002209 [Sorochytrium milnesiophthora]